MSAGPLLAIVAAGSFAIALIACAVAWRMRARALDDRLALRVALAREDAFVEAARRIAGASAGSIDAVREEIHRAVKTLAPSVDLLLFFEERDAVLACVAAFGERAQFFDAARLALDDESALVVQALRRGHRVSRTDWPQAARLHPRDGFAAAIPLVLETGQRCVLYAASVAAALPTPVDRVVELVDQAAPAYRIALERAEDRARAEFDGLTGLLTPRAFRSRLAALMERVRFAPLGRVGVLFIDTDRFKAWNDTYGHASGDALLRELAQLLRASATEPGDIAARNGGDEFCVVFADTEKSRAVERAERLRASIAQADFRGLHGPVASGADVRISASIGIACFPIDAQSPEALLEKADEAMYHSKKTGRNGVSFFGVDAVLVRADGASGERTADRRRE